MHRERGQVRTLLTARQVQNILHVDRSTIYRMAEDGRLPSIRVGRQWRFPADDIRALVDEPRSDAGDQVDLAAADRSPIDTRVAQAACESGAELLGVMMVVTDMDGRPLTPIANPCPWFVAHRDDPGIMDACLGEWRALADDVDFEPRFHLGRVGFECARAFIRSGSTLVGMVLAGGVSPTDHTGAGFYDLTGENRERVLRGLPRIAAAISHQVPQPVGAGQEEKR